MEEIRQNPALAIVDMDVEEGNLTLIEAQQMNDNKADVGTTKSTSTEPAKWKSFVIIYIGVLIVALPLNLWLKPALINAGMGVFGSFMLNTCCVVSCLNFVVVPLLSKICRPFMNPWRPTPFDFLAEVRINEYLQLALW